MKKTNNNKEEKDEWEENFDREFNIKDDGDVIPAHQVKQFISSLETLTDYSEQERAKERRRIIKIIEGLKEEFNSGNARYVDIQNELIEKILSKIKEDEEDKIK